MTTDAALAAGPAHEAGPRAVPRRYGPTGPGCRDTGCSPLNPAESASLSTASACSQLRGAYHHTAVV